jgi:septal ring factor EnvC (AmiA/AmiB activator)
MAFPIAFIAKPALKLLGNKWVWIGITVATLATFGYWQHDRATQLKYEKEQLMYNIEIAQQAKQKLLDDITRMNNINKSLEESKKDAEERLEAARIEFSDFINTLPTISTPEEKKEAQRQTTTLLRQSYGCLEAATGKKGALCDR